MSKIDLKVVFLGMANVGKTCLVERFLNDTWVPNPSSVSVRSFFSANIRTNLLNTEPKKIRTEINFEIWGLFFFYLSLFLTEHIYHFFVLDCGCCIWRKESDSAWLFKTYHSRNLGTLLRSKMRKIYSDVVFIHFLLFLLFRTPQAQVRDPTVPISIPIPFRFTFISSKTKQITR
jgi:hypothetical protein